jgi:gliding motility-associated-like protein
LGADTIICEGDSIDIQLNDTSFMNVWGNGDSSFNIQILHADTITVMVYNMCGNVYDTLVIDSVIPALVHFPDDTILCANDSLLLDATIHFGQYIWNTGSMDSLYLVDSAGTYSVTATNFCGVDSDTITVYYDDSPITNLGPDSTYCLTSLINLNAYWSRAQYLWNTSDTTSSITANYSGNFSVQVTNLCGYDGDTVNIQYDIPISFNLGADTILCKGDSFVIAAPAHNATWLWNDGSVDSTIQVHEPGVFNVLAKNKCGSFGDSIHVNARQKPIITEQIMDTSFCKGFTYHVSVDRNNSRSIIWNFGSTSFEQSLDSAGTYSYTVENICGISQDTFTLDLEFPAAASLGNDTVICYGDPIVKSFPYADHTFLWNTGSTDSVKIITETGVYGVTIWTPANCESYAEFTVSNCDAQLYIPNAFTPGNGDNLNNSFKVEGVSVFKYHIVIYDRWGLQVFESTDINISWDGTINGQDAATGIYSYKIWFNTGLSSGTNFQSVTRVGLVNLVR